MAAEFEGRVGVVTGAAGGLGKAVARLALERGARIFLVDIDGARLSAVVSSLHAQGLAAHAVVADIADEDQVAEIRRRIEGEAGGALDFLVNNAGGWRYGRAGEITMGDWDWTFRTNLTGTFLMSRALMGLMVARRYGRIVNVASSDAYRAKPTLPHYAAAKAAVVSLTKSLAEELAPAQVLVNGVSPGAILTEVAKAQGWMEERIRQIPLGRAAEPEDIAEVIAFLASSRNRFMVGETVIVNGGLYMA